MDPTLPKKGQAIITQSFGLMATMANYGHNDLLSNQAEWGPSFFFPLHGHFPIYGHLCHFKNAVTVFICINPVIPEVSGSLGNWNIKKFLFDVL